MPPARSKTRGRPATRGEKRTAVIAFRTTATTKTLAEHLARKEGRQWPLVSTRQIRQRACNQRWPRWTRCRPHTVRSKRPARLSWATGPRQSATATGRHPPPIRTRQQKELDHGRDQIKFSTPSINGRAHQEQTSPQQRHCQCR